VDSTVASSSSLTPSAASAVAQSIVSRDARWLVQVLVTHRLDCGRDLLGEGLDHVRHPQPHDLHLTLEARVLHPVVEASPLQRVVDVTRAIGREDHDRWGERGEQTELRDRHLVVRQHLEQIRLELVVGAVDLVDQQDRLASGGGGRSRAAAPA
jgi:hypothetical protein